MYLEAYERENISQKTKDALKELVGVALTISKIPEIDTEVARALLHKQILGSAERFIESTTAALGQRERSITVQGEVDPTLYQKIQRDRALTPHHRALLRAFCTHAVWSGSRLRSMGYNVDGHCHRCGHACDSLYHRLWECPSTADIRADTFEDMSWSG